MHLHSLATAGAVSAGDRLSLFAACSPGFESLVAAEVAELGGRDVSAIPGGVEFSGDLAALYRVNLCSGLASAVRVRVARFEARFFNVLVREVQAVDWGRFIGADRGVQVRATSRRSKLYHTGGIEQRVVEGITHSRGPVEDADPVVVHARIVRDQCELSVDTSGEALHRRGWRLQTAKAPLREDLAYALLRVSGWQPTMALCDPMMGSGTIVIEAARRSRGIPPGWDRSFAFERMPGFRAAVWADVRASVAPGSFDPTIRIRGSDRDRGALEAARGNAERAGVGDLLDLAQAEVTGEALGAFDAVVTNPPYGRRVESASMGRVRAGWRALGDAVRASASVRSVALAVPDRALASATGLPLRPVLMTDHGGLKVEFMALAQSNRQPSDSIERSSVA